MSRYAWYIYARNTVRTTLLVRVSFAIALTRDTFEVCALTAAKGVSGSGASIMAFSVG